MDSSLGYPTRISLANNFHLSGSLSSLGNGKKHMLEQHTTTPVAWPGLTTLIPRRSC